MEVFFKVRLTIWMLFQALGARNFQLCFEPIENKLINRFLGDVESEFATEPFLNLTIALKSLGVL